MDGLEVVRIEKSYGATAVLKGLNLECRPGEIHGLLGQNGSGKSTLTKILSGITRADSGTIRLGAKEIDLKTPQLAQKQRILTVFQELTVLPNLTVAENLFLGLEPINKLRMVSVRDLHEQAADALKQLGIGNLNPRQMAGQLSVAERQIVEVAKALMRDPHVLILDEATASLGPKESQWVFEQARRLAERGNIVLFTSHRLAEVEQHADRISVLRDGVRVLEVARGEVDTEELVTVMLGYKVEQLYPRRSHVRSTRPVLAVDHLSVGHKVHDVSLAVGEGEILGIAAMPGQGQRELFYSLYGEMPSRGDIAINGQRVRLRSPRDALKAGVCLVPEDRKTEGLLLPLGIGHNLSLVILDRLARAGIVRRRREREEIQPQCQQLRLPIDRLREPVGSLSGGNQQKVVLGKVLLNQPQCLLLFDCTRGVDVGTKAEIYRLMANLSAQKVGMLFYSSDLQELVNLCDRVAVLYEGQLIKVFDDHELNEEEILKVAVGLNQAPEPITLSHKARNLP
jgi:ABC-type sugar transport system ATPase subunit